MSRAELKRLHTPDKWQIGNHLHMQMRTQQPLCVHTPML